MLKIHVHSKSVAGPHTKSVAGYVVLDFLLFFHVVKEMNDHSCTF